MTAKVTASDWRATARPSVQKSGLTLGPERERNREGKKSRELTAQATNVSVSFLVCVCLSVSVCVRIPSTSNAHPRKEFLRQNGYYAQKAVCGPRAEGGQGGRGTRRSRHLLKGTPHIRISRRKHAQACAFVRRGETNNYSESSLILPFVHNKRGPEDVVPHIGFLCQKFEENRS